MADNKNLTIWQKLGVLFGPDKSPISTQSKSYSLDTKELLKTKSKDEYNVEKLQAQQSLYLKNQWEKVDNTLYQQAVFYETTRIASYTDFESMEFFPEISAALDILMEESTTQDSKGRVLQIFSESERVKKVLNDLFYNRLDIQTTLPMWTRNTPVREDSIIPLLDGTETTIKDLSTRIKNGEEIWTYSIQDGTKSIVPGRIIWCDLTRKDSELIRVTLDDGTHIDTTPDHEYMLRDGSYKRADELNEGQSLMPFYTTITNPTENVYNPNTNTYINTNSIVTRKNETKELEFSYEYDNNILNHKVVSVIKLNETSDVYCMEVVGPNGENDRHNFPICSKNVEGLYSRNGVFLSNCKYGDNFLYLDIDDKNGITNCKQLPNIEIERHEGDVYNSINGVIDIERNKKKGDDLKFVWKNREFEFNSWQIAHFRLLGDDRRLPYGTSVLEKARRIYKQLLLSEDAMLIYRITRAPERRIFKIFVGNIDDKDVEPYVQQIANKFKRAPIIDPKTGQIDLRYNQMSNDQDFFIPVRDPAASNPIETLAGACISLDTRIPLLDGRTLSLNEIISEWDNGNRNLWVYSCNPKTGEFVPGMITWAGVTRKNTDVMKITLDNGEEIIATPDHKFVHRTKGFVPTNELKVGDSLMPFYSKKTIYFKHYDYQQIFDNNKQKWVWVHKEVAKFHKGDIVNETTYLDENKDKPHRTIHHVNFNRFDNSPTNLTFMESKDHIKFHRKNQHIATKVFSEKYKNNPNFAKRVRKQLTEGSKTFHNKRNSNPDNLKLKGQLISAVKSTPEVKEKISKMSKSLWERPDYKEYVFNKKQTLTFSDKLYNMFVNEFEKHLRVDITLNILNNNSEFMSEFTLINGGIRSSLTNLDTFTHNHLEKMIKQKGFKNFREWKQNEITKRGFINIRQWQYYVDKEKGKYGDKNKGKSINQFYNHKIVKIEYLQDKIDTGTITVDGNEIYHNYHTFALESGVYIKNSNLSEIADIEYLQKKLFAALRIPKPFLGFESAVGDGKNLALQDIRFTRTVNRIQQSMLQELNKIAIIHLFILGLDEELNNFTLALNNPSTQAEVLRTEHLQAKMQLYKDSVSDAGNGFAAMSMTRAKKEILNFSNEEIRLDLEQQRLEKAAAAELVNTANVIKKSGLFDKVDRLYGDTTVTEATSTGESVPTESMGSMEGSAPEMPESTPEGATIETTSESVNDDKVDNLLLERKEVLKKEYEVKVNKYSKNFMNKLIESIDNDVKDKIVITDKEEVSNLNNRYNEEINGMMDNIDQLLKK